MKSSRLLLMPLAQEQDVVECRNRARKLAAGCQFDKQDQIRIATAVSEIARNAFRYAKGAMAEFALAFAPGGGDPKAASQLICTIKDRGPGIPNLPEILAGSYKSSTGMGMGIIGARRLMDQVDIETNERGTVVRLAKDLPRRKVVTLALLQPLLDEIGRSKPATPLEEISSQNQELFRTLEEVSKQREELVSINDELRETNRGVVALYDELDTIYRVGRVVASKLDRELLLQAITNATTDISAADLGIFIYQEAASAHPIRHCLSGPLSTTTNVVAIDFAGLWNLIQHTSEIVRIDDLSLQGSLPAQALFPFPVRSYLYVPVADADGRVAAGLVFLHQEPHFFSERSERILSTVAVQAAMGLENAKLYHDVQSASAAKDQFISNLSHELRTPLNPVFAILTGLEQNPIVPEELRSELVTMRRNLELEARLIDDLLDLTRIIKGAFPLHMEVVDVQDILRSACETCGTLISISRVHIDWDLRATQVNVKGDPARLQQVFWNLLGNAVKFSQPGGGVTIRSESVGNELICISIIDRGRGITAEAMPKIFHPFEQGDSTVASQFGGLGLGLAISQSILKSHDGTIRAESSGRNQGASFIVTLPVTLSVPEEPKVSSPRVPVVKGVHILLVDDHDDTRNTFSRLLVRRGHQVKLAATCAEARALADQHLFDLVISDLGLPDGSGHDLMRALQSAHKLPGIALSGFGMAADLQRSREAGFAFHLTKPVDFTALDAAIAAAVGGPSSS